MDPARTPGDTAPISGEDKAEESIRKDGIAPCRLAWTPSLEKPTLGLAHPALHLASLCLAVGVFTGSHWGWFCIPKEYLTVLETEANCPQTTQLHSQARLAGQRTIHLSCHPPQVLCSGGYCYCGSVTVLRTHRTGPREGVTDAREGRVPGLRT